MPGEPLSRGNTAKLYCLQLIDRRAGETDGDFRLLDLGCGDRGQLRADAAPTAQRAVRRGRAVTDGGGASTTDSRLGSESRYRARVRDDEFRSLAERAGLKIV